MAYWKENKTFQKSINQRPSDKHYTFYDGPPYATGTPHYGHLLAGILKDVVPRYWAMKGYRVERRFGWDCHGLPVENLVEGELGLNSKKDIEKIGVEKFSKACRDSVLRYVDVWKKTTKRMGRWVDMENDYKTMEPWYMESVWWVFSKLWEKDLVYEGFKVLPYCPRCGTPLSNFELAQPGAYAEVSDPSVFVKFFLKTQDSDLKTYLLVWTTTPWTLPANTALAINPKIQYEKIQLKSTGEILILAKERIKEVIKEPYKSLGKVLAKDLVGQSYEPLFDISSHHVVSKNDHKIRAADFVGEKDGTGIVHIAPAYGEDDMALGQEFNLSMPQTVDSEGKIVKGWGLPGEGKFVKEADTDIIGFLKKKKFLYKSEQFIHSYPHCWRCDTPLLYKALNTWFVAVTKIKNQLIKNNKQIHWVPGHLKAGRFGKMLETAPDWTVSRNRYWGVPIPLWRCEDCGELEVFGSIAELEKRVGKKITDIHKHIVDEFVLACKKCKGKAKRVPEVLDVWFDSGSMPYAQNHYPFQNKAKFEANFPADFIAEGIDQTRGWFYTLHVLANALFGKHAFKNVVVNGTILAQDGKKMSKRLKNYPEPDLVMEKYGADAMRFYLMTSPAVRAEDLRFQERGVDEVLKKFVLTLWNSYAFFAMHANAAGFDSTKPLQSKNLLDRWILSRLNHTISLYEKNMNTYHLAPAGEELAEFLDDLSNWYIRRSRRRFKGSEDFEALSTLYIVLVEFTKILAPFMPFISEKIHLGLTNRSVHLEDLPQVHQKLINGKLEEQMKLTREIVSTGLAARAQAGIKVRQPLAKLKAWSKESRVLSHRLVEIIKEEVNVKAVSFKKGERLKVTLDFKLTPALKEEGIKRELVRHIQDLRKKSGLTIQDKVNAIIVGDNSILKIVNKFRKDIIAETLLIDIIGAEKGKLIGEKAIKISNKEATLKLYR